MSVFLKGKENQRIHAWYPGSLGWNEKTPQSGYGQESREEKKETARGSEDKQKEKKEEEKQRDQK